MFKFVLRKQYVRDTSKRIQFFQPIEILWELFEFNDSSLDEFKQQFDNSKATADIIP